MTATHSPVAFGLVGAFGVATLGMGCAKLIGEDFEGYRRASCVDVEITCGGGLGSGGTETVAGGSGGTGTVAGGSGGTGTVAGGAAGTVAGRSGGIATVGGSGADVAGNMGGAAGIAIVPTSCDCQHPTACHIPPISGCGGSAGLDPGGSGTSGFDALAGNGEFAGAGAASVPDSVPQPFPSCRALPNNCGPGGSDNCCESDIVKGGSFMMGNDSSGDPTERPAHAVSLPDFKLDRYEVTVGRFRAFVAAYDAWQRPAAGAGAYAGDPATGWQTAWNSLLPASKTALTEELSCEQGQASWSEKPANETLPINCVDWYLAFAFCIWDAARLPTEAEWEYSAAGGALQLTYPWGNSWPDTEVANYANFGRVTRVGIAGFGSYRGHFGQFDLIGNVWEWVRDDFDPNFYASAAATGYRPVRTNGALAAVIRGASYFYTAAETTTTFGRGPNSRDQQNATFGVRCARD